MITCKVIEMICYIENLESKMGLVLTEATGKTDSLQHLHIERNECRKATRTIPRTYKVAIFINEREGEAISYVKNWNPCEPVFCVELTTEEKTVWRIKRQEGSFVPSNDWILEVSIV